MPKIDENKQCHFFELECLYPISKEELEIELEEAEEGEIISAIPVADSGMCTNCLLAQLIDQIDAVFPQD